LSYRTKIITAALFLSLTGAVFSVIKSRQTTTPDHQISQIEFKLAALLNNIEAEFEKQRNSLQQVNELTPSSFEFVVIKQGNISHWSTNRFLPTLNALNENFKTRLIKIGAGEVLVVKSAIAEGEFIVSIIPLHIHYKISNDYLQPFVNSEIFDSPTVNILEPDVEQGLPVKLNGVTLFKVLVQPVSGSVKNVWGIFFVLCAGVALLSLAALGYPWFYRIRKKNTGIGFLLLLVLLVTIRLVMLASDFPGRFISAGLFDPKYFASSEISPSLGDLFLNALVVFALCLYLFANYRSIHLFTFRNLSGWRTTLSGVLYSLALLFSFLYWYVVIQTIYNNSVITFSLFQSLAVNVQRITALLVLIISGISVFMVMHVCIRLLVWRKNFVSVFLCLSIGVLIFIGVNSWSGQSYVSSLLVSLIYVGVVIGFQLYRSLARFQYTSFTYLLIGVLCFALNGVLAVQYFESIRNAKHQFSYAENFLIERDYFGEYLLHEAVSRIGHDAFIQTRMSSPFLSKEPIKQKITQVSLSGYFNRYSVKVLLFNSLGEPLDESDGKTFSEWAKAYDNESFKTEYKNVFYVSNAATNFNQKYLTLVPVTKNESAVGFIVIELSLKKIIPENVYPELLVDNRFQRAKEGKNYSYALITGKDVIYSTGDFNYHANFDYTLFQNTLFTKGVVYKDYLHVGVTDALGRVAIVSAPVPVRMSWLTNFSFFVVLGLMLILILLIVFWFDALLKARRFNLTVRIQLILNLAFFIPLVMVSVVTLGLTSRSVQEQLVDDYLNKAKHISASLSGITNNWNNFEDEELQSLFTSEVNKANVDANLFSLEGKLLASTQPAIFDNQLLSPYLHPAVIKSIKEGDQFFVKIEQAGSLNFSVAYAILLSPESGNAIGILAIPFFQSIAALERLQVTVLGNIMSIFTLIFIALLVISFLVTKWLTTPLQFVTKTLGRISLMGVNKPIQWNSDDEVGIIVREYNLMLEKLEASKRELERTQREKAWREIAQQVAHEIKNPLTPMKLTLQQLERNVEQNGGDKNKLSKAVESLLIQVNLLNDIASSFSSFAKMPEPVLQKINLIEVLTKTVALFKEECNITVSAVKDEAGLMADEKMLTRIFSNLVLNSIQASRPGIPVEVFIRVERIDGFYRIILSDNGKGIDEELREKIFLPHFTTKKSGSGLGLAIAREGISQMGGVIYFNTSPDGTSFIIELPTID
jgi:two-component system, NtrC family, nitrogen regulation sensor histidine kinase NtrY